MKLKDKVVVITGGSEGLGKTTALLLAKEGAKLALLARNEEKLKKVKAEILESGNECEYFVCDVGEEKQVQETVQDILDQFGAVDVLINNAGIWFEGYLEDHPYEKLKELVMTNILGVMYTTRALLPHLKTRDSGQILNIVSIAGVGTPGPDGQYAPYTATKHAVKGFTDSLEEELKGTNIKVMGIYPGGMDTEIFETAGFHYGYEEDWMMKKENVAEIIVFMLTRPNDVHIDNLVVRKFKK